MATKYQSGLRLHEYVLEQCLGAGAFGEVWRARHHVTQSIEVAVKLPIENEYVRFLKHEGDLVHGLRHPNIVSVLGIDPYADTPYLVMELVKGPNLRQVLEQRPEGVMGSTPRDYKSFYSRQPAEFWREEHPLTYVSYDDCLDFCQKLSERVGCEVRLPTEAEWEYACRAGTTTAYAFGSALSAERANCRFNGEGREQPIGQYPPNGWGLCDMHGGVLEWCADWVGEYSREDQADPHGPARGSKRITHSEGFHRSPDQRIQRGGCFEHGPEKARSASRAWLLAKQSNQTTGFRVVTVGHPRSAAAGDTSGA